MREYKNFGFQLKSTNDEQGIIEGYLSVFNNVDLGNDKVMPGAFKASLAEASKQSKANNLPYLFPMLWQHNDNEPIGGVFDASEDSHGLYTKAQFDLDTQRGKEAYSGYKKGYLNQLSIGYETVKSRYDSKGVRELEEIKLWEQSTVTFAMNTAALVTGVKCMDHRKDFSSHYQTAQAADVLSDWYDLSFALKQAAIDSWTIGDQPQADASAALEQFKPAFMAWIQSGIDCNVKGYLDEQNQASSSSYYGWMSVDDRRRFKAGGMSQAKKDTIQAHIDDLHSRADKLLSDTKMHTKAMHSAADDLATVLQGVEPAYTTDVGTPEKSFSPDAEVQEYIDFIKALPQLNP